MVRVAVKYMFYIWSYVYKFRLYRDCTHTTEQTCNSYFCYILAGCALADLGVVATTADERCIGLRNSAQFPGGVVCYSDVTPGSLAVYICNSTHHLEGPRFRECQTNGNWSGAVPQCVAG